MLKWRGKQVMSKLDRAAQAGVNATMAAAVIHAKRNHEWQNRTGTLEGSVQIHQPARKVSGGHVGVWGSVGAGYAIYQELGTRHIPARPFLRPAADVEYPKLAGRIRKAFQ